MKRLTLALALLVLLPAACQQGPVNRPVPSVAQIGEDLNCQTGDHGFEDAAAGWGFCYPATWKYVEKAQGTSNPTRLDITLDITDVPCVVSSPVAGASPRPVCSANAGLFAFMIISTYERGSAPDLVSWMQGNLSPTPDRQAIVWGNALEADRLGDGRRIALTPHQVVIMDLRSGQGQLDLEAALSARLNTWKFSY
jgi:hypothetical protein